MKALRATYYCFETITLSLCCFGRCSVVRQAENEELAQSATTSNGNAAYTTQPIDSGCMVVACHNVSDNNEFAIQKKASNLLTFLALH